jgi:hypothetical protein
MDVEKALRLYPIEDLRDPIVVMAYGGWNDGGESATTAVRHLLGDLEIDRLARIDTEEFLDLTVARPHVRLRDGRSREIVWPNHEFFAARLPAQERDLVIGLGIEPHLRWKAYCGLVSDLIRSVGAQTVVLLGAYLGDVISS